MNTAIILGAAVWPGGKPSPTLRRRVLHGVTLFKAGHVSQLICSGGLGRHPPSEAEVMRQICLSEGVPEAAILLENRSRTTLENLSNAKDLLTAPGTTKVVIVTDSYHRWRALMVARHLGLMARASCPRQSGTAWHRVLKSWLRELPALIWYWWRLKARGKGPSG